MYYNEVSVENYIILCIFAEKGPYNMTMCFVVHLIVTDTILPNTSMIRQAWYLTTYMMKNNNVI